MSVASVAVLAKLRDELCVVADAAVALARAARFRRVKRREKRVAILEMPAAEKTAAEARRERLIRCGRILDALLQRYAVTPPAKAAHLTNSMAAYVLLERELPPHVPEGRSREAFERELRDYQRKLEEFIDLCSAAIGPAAPRVQRAAAIDIHVNGGTAPAEQGQLLADYRRPRAATAAELTAPLVAFGKRLFDIIAPRYRDGCGIRLHLANAGELAHSPWELLHDGRDFLALQPSTPVVRCIAHPRVPRYESDGPLRVLLTISSPPNLRALDAADERRRVEDAVGGLMLLGQIALDVAPDGKLETLRRMLRNAIETGRPYAAWHFIGHGRHHGGRGELAMEGGENGPHWIGGNELQVVFGAHPPLRFAILNACETGLEGVDDPRAGLASTLIGCGAEAVLATQFQISDEAAVIFAEEVYGAYANGADLTGAVAEARRAIFCRPRGVEWMTPVVFVRTEPYANTS